jgi:LysR family transcriptional activator of nhaA
MEKYRWDRVNFSHLFYFYVTAMEGSIKATAEKLHVSQPTVSDQIKLLEEFFKCELFERRNRALFLTKEGELALEYAERLFDLSRELTRRLRHKERLPKTSIDIGLTPYMSQYFLYEKILPIFNLKDVQVNIVEGERHILLAELEEENIDLVFCVDNNGLAANTVCQKLGANRTYALAHKKYKKFKKDFPYSLEEVPYFGHSQSSFFRYDIDLFFSQNGIAPRLVGQGDDLDLFELVTAQGVAFTIVSEVGKNRICRNKSVMVLGELETLQASVWGIAKNDLNSSGFKALDHIIKGENEK